MPEHTGAQQTRLTVLLLRIEVGGIICLCCTTFPLALWALVWSLRVCVLRDFAHKPDPVFLVDVLLHRWIIHWEQVAHNIACSSSSALHLLVITRRQTWTLVFHIPGAASTKPLNPYLAALLCTCYEHWNTRPDKQPRVRAGTWTIQHQDLDFPIPPSSDSESPKLDKFSKWYIIDYFESVCLPFCSPRF